MAIIWQSFICFRIMGNLCAPGGCAGGRMQRAYTIDMHSQTKDTMCETLPILLEKFAGITERLVQIFTICHNLLLRYKANRIEFDRAGYTVNEVLRVYTSCYNKFRYYDYESKTLPSGNDILRIFDQCPTDDEQLMCTIQTIRIQILFNQKNYAEIRRLITDSDGQLVLSPNDHLIIQAILLTLPDDKIARYTELKYLERVLERVYASYYVNDALFEHACSVSDEKMAMKYFCPDNQAHNEALIQLLISQNEPVWFRIAQLSKSLYDRWPTIERAKRLAIHYEKSAQCEESLGVCGTLLYGVHGPLSLDDRVEIYQLRIRCYDRLGSAAQAKVDKEALQHVQNARGDRVQIMNNTYVNPDAQNSLPISFPECAPGGPVAN